MGEKPRYNPYPINTWQHKLYYLGDDFCLNLTKVKEIIDETSALGGTSEQKYRIAYRRLKPLIMAA